MRYLFPAIPHYWILKTKYYTAYRSWFESSLQRRAIRSSPLQLSGNQYPTTLFIVTELYTNVKTLEGRVGSHFDEQMACDYV